MSFPDALIHTFTVRSSIFHLAIFKVLNILFSFIYGINIKVSINEDMKTMCCVNIVPHQMDVGLIGIQALKM